MNLLRAPWVSDLVRHAFQVSFLAYLVYYAVETVAPNFVSLYVSTTPLAVGAVASGLALLLLPARPAEERTRSDRRWVAYAVGLAFGGALVVWVSARGLGVGRTVITAVAGLFILTIPVLLHADDV